MTEEMADRLRKAAVADWKSESIDKLCAALAAAQGSFDTIGRDREVTVKSQSGASYKFSYAPLDVILNAVRPALSKNGLAVSQMVTGEWLRTALFHSSGQWIASETAIGPRPAKMQELGSVLTYLRRYALVAMLGVASEEDDDGNGHDGSDWQARDRYQVRKPEVPYTEANSAYAGVRAPEPAERFKAAGAPAPRQPGEDGMPADLRLVLDAIGKAEDLIQLASVAAAASKLEESLKAEAQTAYRLKKAKLEGKKA